MALLVVSAEMLYMLKLVRPANCNTKFRMCYYKYKSGYNKFTKDTEILQAGFFEHFTFSDQAGMEDWEITLIEQVKTISQLRKRESYW